MVQADDVGSVGEIPRDLERLRCGRGGEAEGSDEDELGMHFGRLKGRVQSMLADVEDADELSRRIGISLLNQPLYIGRDVDTFNPAGLLRTPLRPPPVVCIILRF